MELTEINPLIGEIERLEKYRRDITDDQFFGFPLPPVIDIEKRLRRPEKKSIAYFSMEFGLAPSSYHLFQSKNPVDPRNLSRDHEVFSNLKDMDYYHHLPFRELLDLPIYSGGLGVLAGDTLKSSADLGLSLVGVGILWRRGYFHQKFWFGYGGQFPEETQWDPHSYPGLIPLANKIEINLKHETLHLKLWKYYVFSLDKSRAVPLILLDADIPENREELRALTHQLYRSDGPGWRIHQRLILGIGGARALHALGYAVWRYHLNEGHAALAFIEKARGLNPEEINTLKTNFAYTCHTPVEAGHDRFSFSDLENILPAEEVGLVRQFGTDTHHGGVANLTLLAMNAAERVNAVSQKHGEVTRLQFPAFGDKIQSITNGVHTYTWISASFAKLFDEYQEAIGPWRADPKLLKNVLNLKNDQRFRADLWEAHQQNKRRLAEFLKSWQIEAEIFTICWARRIAPYKRPSMLLQNPRRLTEIAKKSGKIQIIFAGKAHPKDELGFTYVDEMFNKIDGLSPHRSHLKVLFLENYDTFIAKQLISSSDVWLNNPLPPFEASGTSGMKAILNGVLQLSTLDGWIVEAADKGIGRIFGYVPPPGSIGSERELKLKEDSRELYQNLEELVALYYQTARPEGLNLNSPWIDMMINCISESGYFNTHRMVEEYRQRIWQPLKEAPAI